ncbi:LytR/AlgR family response regulator transcription factor [Hymenobacter ruber]
MADLLPLTCVIVDDNEMSRLALEHFVALTPGLELAATLPDGLTALQFLQTHPPIDLLLLDIEMPHLTGLELIRILSLPLPAIVLVTSHHSFAAEAFELPVADYLVKPVDYARFLQAVKQVRALRPQPVTAPPPAPENPNVFAKVNGRLVRINFDDVYYIEALSTYSVLVTATQKHIVHVTLKNLEERLPFSHFVRVHRSYIVNTRRIDAIDDHQLTLGPYTVPVGKLHKAELMRRLAPL